MHLSNEQLKALMQLNVWGQRRRVVDELQEQAPLQILERMRAEDPERSLHELDTEKEIAKCEAQGVRLLTWFDATYPEWLKEIYDPPLVLYMKGSLDESDEAAVAIVGTRRPSYYGIQQAKRFARELASNGLTIVSGLAKGIDQEAHSAALEIPYGRTIAILGCGIDVDYPKGSQKLREKIIQRGALLSEYPIGTTPRPENFPKRNRIISGLSRAVLVIEAHSRSGSLITAHQAADQGRDVFAIPGPVNQLTSAGTNRLIKEGAMLTEAPFEILEVIHPVLKGGFAAPVETKERVPQVILESEEEKTIFEALGEDGCDMHELFQTIRWPAPKVMGLITQMELSKKIVRNEQGKFSRT